MQNIVRQLFTIKDGSRIKQGEIFETEAKNLEFARKAVNLLIKIVGAHGMFVKP